MLSFLLPWSSRVAEVRGLGTTETKQPTLLTPGFIKLSVIQYHPSSSSRPYWQVSASTPWTSVGSGPRRLPRPTRWMQLLTFHGSLLPLPTHFGHSSPHLRPLAHMMHSGIGAETVAVGTQTNQSGCRCGTQASTNAGSYTAMWQDVVYLSAKRLTSGQQTNCPFCLPFLGTFESQNDPPASTFIWSPWVLNS